MFNRFFHWTLIIFTWLGKAIFLFWSISIAEIVVRTFLFILEVSQLNVVIRNRLWYIAEIIMQLAKSIIVHTYRFFEVLNLLLLVKTLFDKGSLTFIDRSEISLAFMKRIPVIALISSCKSVVFLLFLAFIIVVFHKIDKVLNGYHFRASSEI